MSVATCLFCGDPIQNQHQRIGVVGGSMHLKCHRLLEQATRGEPDTKWQELLEAVPTPALVAELVKREAWARLLQLACMDDNPGAIYGN